jgi:hypothetical protein
MKNFKYVNEDNYFDLAEACHCFASLNHGGMHSHLYKMLSRSEFKPGYAWSETTVENENECYSMVNEENIETILDEIDAYFEQRDEE